MTRTVAYLYAPTRDTAAAIPEDAWTLIIPPPESISDKRKLKR
jgi:hypothetical protein